MTPERKALAEQLYELARSYEFGIYPFHGHDVLRAAARALSADTREEARPCGWREFAGDEGCVLIVGHAGALTFRDGSSLAARPSAEEALRSTGATTFPQTAKQADRSAQADSTKHISPFTGSAPENLSSSPVPESVVASTHAAEEAQPQEDDMVKRVGVPGYPPIPPLPRPPAQPVAQEPELSDEQWETIRRGLPYGDYRGAANHGYRIGLARSTAEATPRDSVIEECAQIVDRFACERDYRALDIAAAIRALKEKP